MKVLRNKDNGNFMTKKIKSFFHAVDGMKYATLYEHNMFLIVLAMIVVSIFGYIYHIKPIEWMICILCFGLVSGVELINTAIEALVDLVTLEIHPLAKIAKDTAAAATLVFCIISFILACIIFIPYIF